MTLSIRRLDMKPRQKKPKIIKKLLGERRKVTTTKKSTAVRKPKEPTLLDKIAQLTDELHSMRSRLANAGDNLPAVGIHRISAHEAELERLWEMRRVEQAAVLRQAPLTQDEEEVLSIPRSTRTRSS